MLKVLARIVNVAGAVYVIYSFGNVCYTLGKTAASKEAGDGQAAMGVGMPDESGVYPFVMIDGVLYARKDS